MTIVIGIVLPLVLFFITLPLKSIIFLAKSQIKVLEKTIEVGGSVSEKLGVSKKEKSSNSSLVMLRGVGSTAVGAGKGAVNAGKTAGKATVKATKIAIKTLKYTIKAISALISFIKSVISTLISMGTVGIIILVVIVVVLLVALVSIVVVINNETTTSLGGTGIGGTNIVEDVDTSSWSSTIETMAKWYIANVNTYCTHVIPPNTNPPRPEERKGYPCDLLGGREVGDDCSSFAWACLTLGGYVDGSPVNAPNSSMYVEDKYKEILKNAGFLYYTVDDSTVFEAGDIIIKTGHVEVVIANNGDGTYQTFGWGTVRDSFPSSPNASESYLRSDYFGYYRLSE